MVWGSVLGPAFLRPLVYLVRDPDPYGVERTP